MFIYLVHKKIIEGFANHCKVEDKKGARKDWMKSIRSYCRRNNRKITKNKKHIGEYFSAKQALDLQKLAPQVGYEKMLRYVDSNIEEWLQNIESISCKKFRPIYCLNLLSILAKKLMLLNF